MRGSDACPGDPGQSEVWIGQADCPPKSRLGGEEIECSAYNSWGKGQMADGTKTDTAEEMLRC